MPPCTTSDRSVGRAFLVDITLTAKLAARVNDLCFIQSEKLLLFTTNGLLKCEFVMSITASLLRRDVGITRPYAAPFSSVASKYGDDEDAMIIMVMMIVTTTTTKTRGFKKKERRDRR